MTISEIRKFAAIEHLDTRVVLPVEGGGAWGVGLCFVRRRIEPQAQVEGGQALAAVKRYRGQRGPQKAPVKQDIKLRIGPDILASFKATGPGWQSRINDALRRALPDLTASRKNPKADSSRKVRSRTKH